MVNQGNLAVGVGDDFPQLFIALRLDAAGCGCRLCVFLRYPSSQLARQSAGPHATRAGFQSRGCGSQEDLFLPDRAVATRVQAHRTGDGDQGN